MKPLRKYKIFYKFKILLMYKIMDLELKIKGYVSLRNILHPKLEESERD